MRTSVIVALLLPGCTTPSPQTRSEGTIRVAAVVVSGVIGRPQIAILVAVLVAVLTISRQGAIVVAAAVITRIIGRPKVTSLHATQHTIATLILPAKVVARIVVHRVPIVANFALLHKSVAAQLIQFPNADECDSSFVTSPLMSKPLEVTKASARKGGLFSISRRLRDCTVPQAPIGFEKNMCLPRHSNQRCHYHLAFRKRHSRRQRMFLAGPYNHLDTRNP